MTTSRNSYEMIRHSLAVLFTVLGSMYAAFVTADTDKAFVELTGPSDASDCVILLHGLARTSSSMDAMADALVAENFAVANVDYPSRHHRIELLSEWAVSKGLSACRQTGETSVHVVTHSLGGILIRDYLSRTTIPELARIVMLAPPNHGSKVVDNLKGVPGFYWLNGPAVDQLGTDENSVPLALGPMTGDTAVIAGTRSVNLYLSTFLDNPDDGKVSVASARLEGMCAMLALPVSHPFIMKDEETIEQTINYLQHGRFTRDNAEYLDCELRAAE